MKKYIIIIFLNQIIFGIGVEALNIPTTATSASTSGSGIAYTYDVWINPAAIYKIKNNSIRFSTYNWLGNIPSNEVSIFWVKNRPHYISIQSSRINDLELYGDIPQDQPLGTFSSSWISASYASGINILGFKFGSLIKINFSKLYNKMMYGYTTDLGIFYQFSNTIHFGMNLKNLGYEYSEDLRTSLPMQFGLGISYLEPILKSNLLIDFIKDKNNGYIYKIGLHKTSNITQYNAGFTKQNDILIYGLGVSQKYKNWGLNIGITYHNSTVFNISKYLDLIWFF